MGGVTRRSGHSSGPGKGKWCVSLLSEVAEGTFEKVNEFSRTSRSIVRGYLATKRKNEVSTSVPEPFSIDNVAYSTADRFNNPASKLGDPQDNNLGTNVTKDCGKSCPKNRKSFHLMLPESCSC